MTKNEKSFFNKIILLITLTVICLCSCVLFSGCKDEGLDEKSVLSIEKTHTVNLTDYYTITYSDGSEYVFSVSSGADGKDGESPTIREIYADYLEEHPTATYEEFLKTYLSVNDESETVAINKVLLSSVKIYSEFIEAYYAFPHQSARQKTIYSGGGIIYKIEGEYTYLVTNYHVIYNASSSLDSNLAQNITCYIYGSEAFPTQTDKKDAYGCTVYDYGEVGVTCEYVGGSVSSDLALLRAKTADLMTVNEDICSVQLSDGYCVGQTAIAIGNPNDDGISVTKGIVSIDNEFISLSLDGTTRSYRSMRIDTPLYSGNSGGGLFDSDGRLIGVCNAGAGEEQNVNFAIPVDIVESVVENLLYYGKQGQAQTKKIVLGVTVTSENSKYVYDDALGYGKIIEDVKISEVTQNSIANSLGLNSDDQITSITINDKIFFIDRYFKISDVLFKVRENDEISVTVIRGGTEFVSTKYLVKESDLTVVD